MNTLEFDLGLARNMCGQPLSDDIRQRLIALVEAPSQETWDATHGILLAPSVTLWQAIREVEPAFPAYGKVIDVGDDGQSRVVMPWPRVPGAQLVRRAIRWATH